jgi:hypothetical protein
LAKWRIVFLQPGIQAEYSFPVPVIQRFIQNYMAVDIGNRARIRKNRSTVQVYSIQLSSEYFLQTADQAGTNLLYL